MNDINSLAEKCDEKIQGGSEHDICALVEEVKKFTSDNNSNEKRSYAHYLLGNLHGKLALLRQEVASGWRNDSYPTNLTAEINNLRQAKTLISEQAEQIRNEVMTNLSNSLAHQRRSIEILNDWNCDFGIDGDAPFVSSLSKARELIWISRFLNDDSHKNLYLYEAFRLIKNLKDHIHITDHPAVIKALNDDPVIVNLLKNGEDFFAPIANWQTVYVPEEYTPEERSYRGWCLNERLFVNPINDITTAWIADQDILQFPSHTVKIGDGPYFAASFSALKREFCFARYMAYEGIHQIHSEFETAKLYLVSTLDYVDYSGSTEKIKTAFRICFSVLDSLAAVMNNYFDCRSSNIAFTPKWIKESFKDKEVNHFVDALYWLACDLFDNEKAISDPSKWKAPNPESSQIRKIRNAIEHGWLRVAEHDCPIWNKDHDYAYVVTPLALQKHTLTLLRLVRAAMLYLTFSVKMNENSKEHPDEIIGICLPMWQSGYRRPARKEPSAQLAFPRGFEPPTCGLGNRRSIQLSYGNSPALMAIAFCPAKNQILCAQAS